MSSMSIVPSTQGLGKEKASAREETNTRLGTVPLSMSLAPLSPRHYAIPCAGEKSHPSLELSEIARGAARIVHP